MDRRRKVELRNAVRLPSGIDVHLHRNTKLVGEQGVLLRGLAIPVSFAVLCRMAIVA